MTQRENLPSLYEIARLHRDRVWNLQHDINPRHPGWKPDDHSPQSDAEWFWYLQGKAEAFATIMREIEGSR